MFFGFQLLVVAPVKFREWAREKELANCGESGVVGMADGKRRS